MMGIADEPEDYDAGRERAEELAMLADDFELLDNDDADDVGEAYRQFLVDFEGRY